MVPVAGSDGTVVIAQHALQKILGLGSEISHFFLFLFTSFELKSQKATSIVKLVLPIIQAPLLPR